mmetsp:Transcript_3085/g.11479  ORF Transcript_3085/g.11479 Transcript_3085/m.11479 type:complete len:230 (-) Transcript_3085:475-1164(-)
MARGAVTESRGAGYRAPRSRVRARPWRSSATTGAAAAATATTGARASTAKARGQGPRWTSWPTPWTGSRRDRRRRMIRMIRGGRTVWLRIRARATTPTSFDLIRPHSTPTPSGNSRGRVPACRSSSSSRTGSRCRRPRPPTSPRRSARSPGTPKPRARVPLRSRAREARVPRARPGCLEERRRKTTMNGPARGTRPAPWTVSTGGTSSSASGSDAPLSSASGTRSAAAG